MALEVGEVFEGKVTGITKFGAFVAMPDGKNGLVHISEIANTYVNDINEFVKEGQVVKVRVIGIGDGGKVNLSMKQAETQAQLEMKKAEDGIKREIVEVSTALANKLLEREINADDHRNLIDSFIEKIGDEE